MSDIAIKIENLSKQYKLGAIGGQTLNAELQSWWARKRGKEDPNLKIGQDYSKYGELFWALDGINLEVKKGEAVGIIGSNGAGKSTLLKILSRVTAPTDGDIWIDGRIASMLEVGTGFHGELTGRENIYMNGAILGMPRKEVDKKIESIIDFSECRQFIDTPVKRYSSGMYVRLAFAVASHLDAEIMIMDEVLAVGDMSFQQKCLNKMGNEADGGKTILYVSHNMNTIRKLCKRAVVLDHGHIAFDGDTEDAIGIYMGAKREKIREIYDFSESPRGDVSRTTSLVINSLSFKSGSNATFIRDEKIEISINISFKTDCENLKIALQLFATDYTRIGIAISDETISGNAGETKDCKIVFDSNPLVAGVYCARVWLFGVNEFGTRKDYDKPLEDICFEIIDKNPHIQWTMNWGYAQFNDLEIK